MLKNSFKECELSRLGFGTMRLPLRPGETAAAAIDTEQVNAMVDYAMAHGINYFDTAYPYHSGLSEKVVGAALARYPRESYYLADKYPGHQISSTYDPAAIFEEQLDKCGVEYFDFYLLHNVYENSIEVYRDERWKIVDYFVEQKRLGRIRHLGFSTHGGPALISEFLDYCGKEMDFCQIQLNYLDWTLQQAKEKYDLLTAHGIPVWVMEPIRGGKLASLPEQAAERLRQHRPEESGAGWALRFLQGLPNVKMILSGMSNLEQMKENISIFEEEKPLSAAEQETLFSVAEQLKNAVPCTACRYCCDGCPKGLDIPALIAAYNEVRYQPGLYVRMKIDALPAEKQPSACIACGKCSQICPQGIDVPTALHALAEAVPTLPNWAEICKIREEEAKRNREQNQQT